MWLAKTTLPPDDPLEYKNGRYVAPCLSKTHYIAGIARTTPQKKSKKKSHQTRQDKVKWMQQAFNSMKKDDSVITFATTKD